MGVRTDEGEEAIIGPNQVFDLPPGHVTWVEGDEELLDPLKRGSPSRSSAGNDAVLHAHCETALPAERWSANIRLRPVQTRDLGDREHEDQVKNSSSGVTSCSSPRPARAGHRTRR